MTDKSSGRKGYAAEEALRHYFINLGYFAVRSVPFNYKSFDVTDIDLWLYMRSSALSRERTCVDIKNKKTPQAMERVFWTKGLREVLGVERAMVATTDTRKETQDFGAANGVTVLHGEFLRGVLSGFEPTNRITEDELFGLLKAPCVVDSNVVWAKWLRKVKSTLIDGLNFNGCNKFLIACKLLIQEYLVTAKNFLPIIRLLYIVIAYFLLTLDYATCSIGHLEVDDRKARLDDGLRYGEAGRERTDEIVNMALHLLADSGRSNLFSGQRLREEFQKQLSDFPAEILAEYFSKSEPLNKLFPLAKEFESAAYAVNLVLPHDCPADHKAVIGLLCDFLGVNRRDVI